ncbi:3'-5' exonuclease [Salinicola avicenniae]|uniref:3'-5' exonuclease n=1 Tax=Salinicola avicenniae TaxID=2916836 RepID=UPI0020730A73|nr:3'-5' exonuclease [Salinicola sp. S1-1-8]
MSRRFGFRRQAQPNWPDYLAARATQAADPRLKRYFETGLPDPATPISEVPLMAMDFETTGLDSHRHDIVSVGLVPFTLDRIRPAEGKYWVLAPRRQLSDESVAFHHITHAEVADAPDFASIIDELLAQITGRLVVVHYRQLERSFLDAAFRERVGEGLLMPMLDTMSLEARIHRQSWWARLRRWAGRPMASIRLHESRQRYHLPAYTGHHALVDSLATAELLQAQILYHYSWDTPVSALWR